MLDFGLQRRGRLIGLILGLCALFLIPSAMGAAEKSKTVQTHGPVKVGEQMPVFMARDLEGTLIRSPQLLSGEVDALIVSFWATWCGACKKGFVELEKTMKSTDFGANVQIVLVGVGEEKRNVQIALKEWKMPAGAVNVLDPYQTVAKKFGVSEAIPRTFVMSGDGTVRSIYVVEGKDFGAAIEASIKAAIKG